MHLVLLGYMGSGKSSTGQLLASITNRNFQDLDNVIATSEGMTISELFRRKGEIYFRNMEAEVLNDLLQHDEPIMIATGGGTPCYGRVMDELDKNENAITVYLKTSLEVLTQRLFPERHNRPLIAHLETEVALKDFIRKHLFERSFYYNQADIIVDCDERNPKEIVEQILLELF